MTDPVCFFPLPLTLQGIPAQEHVKEGLPDLWRFCQVMGERTILT